MRRGSRAASQLPSAVEIILLEVVGDSHISTDDTKAGLVPHLEHPPLTGSELQVPPELVTQYTTQSPTQITDPHSSRRWGLRISLYYESSVSRHQQHPHFDTGSIQRQHTDEVHRAINGVPLLFPWLLACESDLDSWSNKLRN